MSWYATVIVTGTNTYAINTPDLFFTQRNFSMIFSGIVTWMWNQWKFRGLVLHTADIWHLWTMMFCQGFHQGKWRMSSCHTWHIKHSTPHSSCVVHHIPSQFHLYVQGFKLFSCPKFIHLSHMYVHTNIHPIFSHVHTITQTPTFLPINMLSTPTHHHEHGE